MWGTARISPIILTWDINAGVRSASHSRLFHYREKCAGSLGGWVEPRSRLNTVTRKKKFCVRSESNPDSRVVQAIAQLLYWRRYTGLYRSGSGSSCSYKVIDVWVLTWLTWQQLMLLLSLFVVILETETISLRCTNDMKHITRRSCSVFLTVLHTTFHALWLHTVSSNQFVEFPLLGFMRNTYLHKQIATPTIKKEKHDIQ